MPVATISQRGGPGGLRRPGIGGKTVLGSGKAVGGKIGVKRHR